MGLGCHGATSAPHAATGTASSVAFAMASAMVCVTGILPMISRDRWPGVTPIIPAKCLAVRPLVFNHALSGLPAFCLMGNGAFMGRHCHIPAALYSPRKCAFS